MRACYREGVIAAELSPRTIGLTQTLIRPVQLQLNPLEHVDVVIGVVHQDPIATPEDYLAALDEALGSTSPIARLLPEYHPEVILRRFLSEIRRRLAVPYN